MSVALPDWTTYTFSATPLSREPERNRVVPEGSVAQELHDPRAGSRVSDALRGSTLFGACVAVPVEGSMYQKSITPPPWGTVDTRIPDALQLMTWTPSREVQTV